MSTLDVYKKVKQSSVVLLTILLTYVFGLGTESVIMALMGM